MGHRRVVLLSEAPDKPPALADAAWSARRDGLLAGLRANDARVAERSLVNRNPKLDAPQALKDLLRRPPSDRPTAVYMPLDASAEIYAVAAELKLKIPRDLTLVACGDANLDPKRTGVRFDARRLGAVAIHLPLDRVRDPKWKTRRAMTRRLPGHYAAGRTHARAAR